MAYSFDTLGYAKHIEAAGVDHRHAEAQAEAARDFIMAHIVTKADLREAVQQLTIRLGGLVALGCGVVIAVLGFLIRSH